MLKNRNSVLRRRGEVNPTVLVVGGLVAAAVIGIIIALAVHHHRKEVARTSTQAHVAACNELQAQISMQKSPLTGAGLSFQPYQSRFDAASRKQKQAEAVVDRDPQQAEQVVIQAEQEFKSVLADLQLAVQVKGDRSGASALSHAEQSVAQVRSQRVSWNYPGSQSGRNESYLLNESGQNPDSHLDSSRRLLATIDSTLAAGQAQDAARILSEAKSEAASAERCISVSMESKQAVESKMAAVAQSSETTDSAYLQAVEQAYFSQEFVGAAAKMDALTKLIADRKETRELVAYCQRLSGDAGRTIKANAEYSSYATDQKFSSLKEQLAGLSAAATQSGADWAELKATGQRIEKGLNEVKDEAVQAHREHDDAVFAVKSFHRDYEQADRNGLPPLTFWSRSTHGEITNRVKERCSEVDNVLGRVERLVKLNKQDWRQIKLDSEAGSALLADLRVKVEEDNKRLEQLLVQKELLKQVTSYSRYACTINGRSYNSAEENRRDREFSKHVDNASDRYDVGVRAWRASEGVGFEDAVRSCKQEIRTVNNIGWYNMLRMMRTSSDTVAQKVAWDNGFRDDKSCSDWVDGFVSKRATGADGLWQPDTRSTTGGSADFGPPLDFNAPLPN